MGDSMRIHINRRPPTLGLSMTFVMIWTLVPGGRPTSAGAVNAAALMPCNGVGNHARQEARTVRGCLHTPDTVDYGRCIGLWVDHMRELAGDHRTAQRATRCQRNR